MLKDSYFQVAVPSLQTMGWDDGKVNEDIDMVVNVLLDSVTEVKGVKGVKSPIVDFLIQFKGNHTKLDVDKLQKVQRVTFAKELVKQFIEIAEHNSVNPDVVDDLESFLNHLSDKNI